MGFNAPDRRNLENCRTGMGPLQLYQFACGLYERFIDSQLKAAGQEATPSAFHAAAASDIGCKKETMERFWNGFRLGPAACVSTESLC